MTVLSAGRAAVRSRVTPLVTPLDDPPLLRLWLAELASEVGDWIARLALSMMIYHRTGSALLTAAVFAAAVAPRLGPGQWLSTYADRVGRRAVMVSSDLVRAALFGVLALAALPLWLVIVLTALAGLASEPFRAARAAAVIEVTPPARRPGALTLTLLTEDGAVLLGYGLGGVVVAALSPAAALGLNAATFVVSAVLLAGLPRLASLHDGGGSGRDTRSAGQTLRAAASALRRDPVSRRTAMLILTAVPTVAAIVVLVVPEVIESIPHIPWASGLLLAGMPAATLVVTVLIGTDAEAPGLLPRIGVLIAAPALLAVLLFASGMLPLQLLGFIVVGAMLAPLTPAFVLLGLRLPADLRASCFSLVSGLVTAAQVLLTLAAGGLAQATTPVTAAAACCALPLLVSLVHLARPVRDRPAQLLPAAAGDPRDHGAGHRVGAATAGHG